VKLLTGPSGNEGENKVVEKKEPEIHHRDLMVESARITRGNKNVLFQVKRMKVDSLKALIIPSFSE
jgi:enhancing lycopene biosynthesis protein 2